MRISVVIMAGGVGTRFWPESRERKPKQLLDVLTPGTSLVQATLARTQHFAAAEDTIIVTGEAQRIEMQQQLPEIPPENIVSEPFGRNTAPCIALGARLLKPRIGDDGIMVVLPADHIIRNENEFTRLTKLGARLAHETRSLVTIGIHPTRPESGYGYIQLDDENLPSKSQLPDFSEFELRDVFCVKRFAEKPDIDTARRFVESGDFLWNSGMFIWRIDAIEAALREYTPEIMQQIDMVPAQTSADFTTRLREAYSTIRGVSIDYGVMEHAPNVYVLRAGALGWSDVGSWDEVFRLSEKDLENNVLMGAHVIARNTKGSLAISRTQRLVALYGVSDLVVVETEDAILVTRRDQAQGVREIVDYLKRSQMNEYL
ncbi:MAG: sugar phosphate nucleotidyltransferase [Bacteroidota bacterium]|nr:sugar phosphate nucleotidyltransferase [Bacteroidota bacterium]MDP4231968.1 sugar phosphate nucleotidyltransferase [Bacteroidota bacterium]MDP4241325.1 sugar phosphate nucleotidyltransferase [Bacteroidota bacterium]MDP4287246.1 sugar phosphate nucleotidyltransferase [Bacteroidota bacterium]